MTDTSAVARHYTHGSLLEQLQRALAASGISPAAVSIEDLAPVDEFHIGGRAASLDFLERLALSAEQHVLDIGCGIGGTARLLAAHCGCRVSGIDITPEFVETGRVLCDWVGLGTRVELHHGSALELPFDAGVFDAAIMLHVGMNIADKRRLCREAHRVLRPGGAFGIYDVMQTGSAPIDFPVPWSGSPETSALAPPRAYLDALAQAGFSVLDIRDRRGFALEFFTAAQRRLQAAGGAPVLGVHITMGRDAALKIANMVQNIAAGRIAPVEIIARRD
ncbi:MAG: class I SAM-dependent methyltransferase [Pseudomonadota bacterium]